jgi:hypothetical protein
MHSSVSYSGIGAWYYREGAMENLGPGELVVFAFLQSYTQAWFLGILFFVSGFFAAASLAKKGRAAFLRERLFRLGVPLLAYMLIVAPLSTLCWCGTFRLTAKRRKEGWPLYTSVTCLILHGSVKLAPCGLTRRCSFFALSLPCSAAGAERKHLALCPAKRRFFLLFWERELPRF